MPHPEGAAPLYSKRSEARPSALLVVAHPGHELRVHGWLRESRPTVLVMTDGSGRGGSSRLAATTRILERAGATPGELYGAYTDVAVYGSVLAGDTMIARRVVDAVVKAALDGGVTQIAADALEGFNPGHDLCRYCVNAAVLLLAARHGKRVESLDFALDGATAHEAPLPPGAVYRELDASAVRAKLGDMNGYSELRADIATLLARHGEAALAREVLRPAAPHEGLVALEREPPYYEVVGEERCAMGVYTEVLRYREHLQPLVRSLWNELGLPWPGEGCVS